MSYQQPTYQQPAQQPLQKPIHLQALVNCSCGNGKEIYTTSVPAPANWVAPCNQEMANAVCANPDYFKCPLQQPSPALQSVTYGSCPNQQ